MVDSRWAMTMEVRPLQQLVEGLLDQALGACVHGGGGFVQDQDARIGQRGAGDREQLPLSLRKTGAAFAQDGLVFVGQALDERIGIGEPDGGLHLLVGGVRAGRSARSP